MLVDIAALRPADSPRLAGCSEEFVRSLASSGAHLSPIVVHRATMRVVDGSHRLKAAVLRGCAVFLVIGVFTLAQLRFNRRTSHYEVR